MSTNSEINPQITYPHQPYKAGFWLIAALPITMVVVGIFQTWVHRQNIFEMVSFSIIFVVFGGTSYLWGITLVKRSGLEPSWKIGLAGGLGFSLSIIGVYPAYDLIFGNLMKLLNIKQTVVGSSPEFMVIFITWTGIVTGMSGLAIGLALKQPKLALKLLGWGFLVGALVFAVIAFSMYALGFRVGIPRADGLPSMPIVTVIGVWSAALVGSEIFGRIISKNNKLEETIE